MSPHAYGPIIGVLSIFAGATLAQEPVQLLMTTSAGDVHIEIWPDAAPVTTDNFLRYVDGGHYDGAQFYRVVRPDNQPQNPIRIEVIQGGLGMNTANPPFAPISHESTDSTGIRHTDGAISMARLEPGSASSEFFICIGDQPELDFGGRRNPDGQGFAAFGQVTQGMDVVRRIQNMATIPPDSAEPEYTSGQILVEPVTIHRVVRAGRGDPSGR